MNLHITQREKSFSLFLLILAFGLWTSIHSAVGQECTEGKFVLVQNDEFFPPSKSAKPYIDFDGRGFIIKGKRTFLSSGAIHYPRVPREKWREVLLKLKRAGFEAVETYIFWNYHEPVEGQYDFTTESRDFGAFLDLAKEIGLYAIVRVGPYVCAEWENGGYPTWLSYKQGLEIRKNNAQYLSYVTTWFNKLMPMVAKRQIQKGGNVILVQLENEMPGNGWRYWGRTSDGPHMNRLMELAKENGLEVPLIFSGIHHAHNPAPDKPIDASKRNSPWMSMELWTIWFDRYNNFGADLTKGERSVWRVISQGGAGFNLYMFHGGTTFGYYNFTNDTKYGDNGEKGSACYDFGTLVGQTGDTRLLYGRLKKLAYQTETFSPVLANSVIDTLKYNDIAGGNIYVTARTSPDGTLVFLNNRGNDTTVVMKNGISVKLAAKEIAAFARDVKLLKGVTLKESSSRILGIANQGGVPTIICYGNTDATSQLLFNKPAAQSNGKNTNAVQFSFPSEGVSVLNLKVDGKSIRVLAMNEETADKTWLVDTKAGRQIVVGAPYLGEFFMKSGGKIYAEIEYPLAANAAPKEIMVYGKGAAHVYKLPQSNTKSPEIRLEEWNMAVYNPLDSTDLGKKTWFSLSDGSAPEMGMDNNNTPYAWYKATLKNDRDVTSLIFKKIGDRATFFIDGKKVAEYNYKDDRIAHIPVNITKGEHELSVFVAHAGRRKFSGYVGPINTLESQKGLRGSIFAEQDSDFLPIGKWQMNGGVDPDNVALKWTALTDAQGFPACFKTQFTMEEQPEANIAYRLVTDGLSFGNVWLNGHNLGCYPELVKNCPGIWLPSCWMKKGNNELIIFDENGKSPQKVSVILEMPVSRKKIILNKI